MLAIFVSSEVDLSKAGVHSDALQYFKTTLLWGLFRFAYLPDHGGCCALCVVRWYRNFSEAGTLILFVMYRGLSFSLETFYYRVTWLRDITGSPVGVLAWNGRDGCEWQDHGLPHE